LVQIKVALYCRVSTYDQSCSRQEQDLINYAEKAQYEVVGLWKETASGFSSKLVERSKVIALAQSRQIDAVLVTELSRWGRSTIDLIHTLNDLSSWNVSLIAITGMQFDLQTPHGKMIATIMSSIAEFERDLIRERVRSGLAAAKARGKILGRRPGQRPKSDRLAPKVLKMVEEGCSYRKIAYHLRLSKTTVVEIVKRHRQSQS
jgi:DNA invertase Pin-like site-specific DNA recombinase